MAGRDHEKFASQDREKETHCSSVPSVEARMQIARLLIAKPGRAGTGRPGTGRYGT
jgi:hypothetical protein